MRLQPSPALTLLRNSHTCRLGPLQLAKHATSLPGTGLLFLSPVSLFLLRSPVSLCCLSFDYAIVSSLFSCHGHSEPVQSSLGFGSEYMSVPLQCFAFSSHCDGSNPFDCNGINDCPLVSNNLLCGSGHRFAQCLEDNHHHCQRQRDCSDHSRCGRRFQHGYYYFNHLFDSKPSRCQYYRVFDNSRPRSGSSGESSLS